MLKLMIVDDEYYTCEGIKRAIDWGKYNIEIAGVASNGKEAIEIVEKNHIDIIITDIKMRGMSGLDMSEELRKNGYAGQIIIMSGYQYFEYAKRAIESNVKRYLVKPIDFEELEEVIKQISEEYAKTQEKYNVKQGVARQMIVEIMEYIDEHYGKDIQLSEIAAKYYRDVTYVSKLFKEYTGMNYNDYLMNKRVEEAKKLLLNTDMSVEDIANEVGYCNIIYFRKVFKSKTNMSPGQYRKDKRNSGN